MRDLPEGWVEAALADVAEVRLGRQRSPKTHFGSNMRPYLRAANVTWNGFDLLDVKDMHFSEAELGTYRLLPGDVLVAEASGSRSGVGKPALWTGTIEDCCFQNTLLRVRSEAPSPKYLLHFLRLEARSGRLGDAARGVGIHHLGAAGLSCYRLPLAPLVEQDRIVAAIEEQVSRLDAGRASLNRARWRLPCLRRSTLARAVATGEKQMLGDLLQGITAGKSFRTDGRQASDGEWGVIKVSAMTWGRFREAENKAVPLSATVDPRFEICAGDVLLSRANTSEYVGATVYVERCRPRLLLSDKSMRLLPGPDIDARWLNHALNSPVLRQQMSLAATGTSDSMRNISQEKVRKLALRVPPLDEQRRLVDELDRQLTILDSLTLGIDHALTRSEHLRRSILESAYSGRLVPQDPSDEPASDLLARIAAQRGFRRSGQAQHRPTEKILPRTEGPSTRRRPRA